jgi:hypothetical protein
MSEKNHRCDCHQLKELLHGPAGKPKESIVWEMAKHDEILNGTAENPHGLVEELRELKGKFEDLKENFNRLAWIGIGIGLAVNLGWLLYTHFHKL